MAFKLPNATGDYAIDCKIGHEMAVQFLSEYQDRPFGLPFAVQQMGRDLNGIEIGFLTEISQRAALAIQPL